MVPGMSIWHEAADDIYALDAKAEEMTTDQRLQLAQAKALLSIAQELSVIHHQGINAEYSSS